MNAVGCVIVFDDDDDDDDGQCLSNNMNQHKQQIIGWRQTSGVQYKNPSLVYSGAQVDIYTIVRTKIGINIPTMN
ncbi:hypothetical protein BLOT_006609 [Blomia tropicalis]|nr:hypothetical protein BLOT_006609 [Blomia tropicalis]